MEEIISYLKKNKFIVLSFGVVLILGIGYFFNHQSGKTVQNELQTETKQSMPKRVSRKKKTESTDKLLVVDIQGAVKKPGVYRAKQGAIVQEVIQMAGGINPNADIKQVNQAKRITDQMQIYIPNNGEKSNSQVKNDVDSNSKKGEPVNINSASVDDFKSVTGIGPKKAEKIIAFREKNGNFKDLHDLTKVSGIGEKSLESLKDQLTV